MSSPLPVPTRPLVVYDGDCGLCQLGIGWLQARWGTALEFLPYQSPAAQRLGLPSTALAQRLHLVEADGTPHAGAAAVWRLLARDPRHARWWRWYARDATFAELSEAAYALVARHRGQISRCLRWASPRRFAGAACRWPR